MAFNIITYPGIISLDFIISNVLSGYEATISILFYALSYDLLAKSSNISLIRAITITNAIGKKLVAGDTTPLKGN